MSTLDIRRDEPGYFELARSIFTGKLGWVSWTIYIMQAILFIAGVYAAVQFFGTADILPAIKWGFSALFLLLAALITKTALTPVMMSNRVLTALERIERRRAD